MSLLRLLPILCLVLLTDASGGPLRISAAASLTEAIREAAAVYQKKSGLRITIALGGSQTLARQIEAGAPADIFLSANSATMQRLVAKGHVDRDSVQPLLTNRLAVIVPADSTLEIESASDFAKPGIRRLSLGDPDLVPAGIYAKAWLSRQGVWPQVRTRVVGMENVRGALATVASGNAESGIVYQTDTLISKRVRVAHLVPANQHPPIVYPCAICSSASHPAQAGRFIDWLKSDEGATLFAKHGFSPAETDLKP